MMHLARILIALTAMLACADLPAADRWLQKRNPEELYAYVDVYQCPVDVAEVTETVHALLVHSRIRPLTEWVSGDIALYITLDCAAEDSDHWVFELHAMLAKFRKERGEVVISFRHDDQFGAFGKGGRELIRKNLEQALDDAFTKYLNANFDLAPGAP